MKCSLCGYEFDKKITEGACKGCPMASFCRLLKCPKCGYEVPAEAGVVKALKSLRSKKNGTAK